MSRIVTEIPPSVEKIKPFVTSEGIGVKLGVPDVTEYETTESEADDEENDSDDENTQSNNEKGSDSEHETDENESDVESDHHENEEEVEDDEEEKEDEFVKTPSNTDVEDEINEESKVDDKDEGDEDKGMDDTTNQFDDYMDVRLNEPTHDDEEVVHKEGVDAEIIDAQQGNENLEITLEQVVEDAHVTISTVAKETEVPVTSSSRSSNLASKFLNFADIPHTDAKIISPMDIHVHHEVPSTQTPTLLTLLVTVITESSPVYTITIPQSLPSFTPPPQLSTPIPPPTTKATNPLSKLPDFASVFQFNNRVLALEKEVPDLKQDELLKTQVTALVDEHLDARLGATRDEFMTFLSAFITAKFTKQVKTQLPQVLPKEVSNFPPPVIQKMVEESLKESILAKESSQPQSTYEAAAILTEFELKKILIDKMDKRQLYLTATEHRECPSAGSDRVLKKRKTSKDAEPTKGLKTKESKSGSSKGLKSQPKSSRKSVQSEELEFEVADSDIPQDQEGNMGKDDEEPMEEVASKPSTDKSLKSFDELMITPINFSAYIMNGLKIKNLTQETLLGPAFRLLKGTRTNYAELEYDFEECYKALSEKLDLENPEGGNYPFDLTKPLYLVMNGNHQMVPVDYFFNNDLKYLQGGVSTMTYTTSITKTKAAQYDLPGIEDMVPNIWVPVKVAYDKHVLWGISHWREQRKTFYGYARGLESRHDVYSTKRILAVTQVEVMRKHGYGYLKEIVVRRADNDLYKFKEGDFPRLRINDIEDMLLAINDLVPILVLLCWLKVTTILGKISYTQYFGKPNGKQIWKSIQNGPTPHPMITDPPPTDSAAVPAPRKKLDSEFSEEENKLEMADTQAEIILSQGLPRHIFNNLNQTSTAKEIWDNVEMLMQGSGRTIQQRKEDLFDEYERFRAIGNESIHDYFVRFHKLVNDMKITQLNIPTHQMNTKFVNNLLAYWGNSEEGSTGKTVIQVLRGKTVDVTTAREDSLLGSVKNPKRNWTLILQ
ncbi:hypothetical protein Tco_1112731 [Tanacetum coccineum]|uniref:Uncharacterized protein n=1 Tax=Tanacetum coccineum TaxID=301880 RepID=A0ABQ5IQ58_9ASTR